MHKTAIMMYESCPGREKDTINQSPFIHRRKKGNSNRVSFKIAQLDSLPFTEQIGYVITIPFVNGCLRVAESARHSVV
jgi:hypothetical protein